MAGAVRLWTFPALRARALQGRVAGERRCPSVRWGEEGLSELSASSQVSVIKVKIHEATGMPAGKQKLQYEVGVSPADTLCFLTQQPAFYKEKLQCTHGDTGKSRGNAFPGCAAHLVTELRTLTAGQALLGRRQWLLTSAEPAGFLWTQPVKLLGSFDI